MGKQTEESAPRQRVRWRMQGNERIEPQQRLLLPQRRVAARHATEEEEGGIKVIERTEIGVTVAGRRETIAARSGEHALSLVEIPDDSRERQ
ncbi:hypothetical protein HPP92_023610 [Vanilla planifolia]|uniref:Uncharacterized protein n=1 Tax=Vanilla planifolia TaxID=51239 RepID=A0A835PQL8_VANPL|nr:hypothetical protein HPP92_023919 [Vanilla planifolia]KAG0455822.1 hypothetical protein HPP92_023610 [Vanilla planifolia]